MRLLDATLAAALLAAPVFAQPVAKDAPEPPDRPHPEWSRSATVYEVNVRQYTPEGTLAAFRRHLPRLDSLGVDVLWLMPVQPIGVKNRKGTLGSYYSIRDYTAVNPEFGTAGDFRAVVDDAHRLGMRVILDWVPNHTAHDHPWVAAHPDWYVRNADGTISNARDQQNRPTDWTDVAELNYDSRPMRAAMIGAMRWWLDSMRVDGFRQDVAEGVPHDFWDEARVLLQASKPDLFLLAEAEAPAMHRAFDMTYGWELHHLLNELAQGKKGTGALDAYLTGQARRYAPGAYRMYFTSNHDENSWQGTEFERMGANHLPAFVLAATLRGGVPLLYTGQEASMKKRLRFFEKDTVDWGGPSLAPFYRAMFDLKHRNEALWNGAWGGGQTRLGPTTRSGPAASRTYAFARTKGANTVVVAVNFGDAPARVAYAGLARPGAYRDWFTGATATLRATGTIEVPANGHRILVR